MMLIHILNPITSTPPLYSEGIQRTQNFTTVVNNKSSSCSSGHVNNKSSSCSSGHLGKARRGCTLIITSLFAACTVVAAAAAGTATGSVEALQQQQQQQQDAETTLSNIPQTLSSECTSSSSLATDCKKPRIQRPKSKKAESCTLKCLTTCIRGGEGSPGEGPFNIRRPLVVFKQGFRSRQYCLVECSDICNLIGAGDDGP